MSSFKKANQKKKQYTLSKSDIDFYKMTGVFAIACIFVLLVMKMQSSRIERIASGLNLTHEAYGFLRSPLFIVPAVIVAAASAVWFILCKIKKTDETKKIFTSTNCLSIVAYIAFFALCFGVNKGAGLHGFFITTTIVLAVIYYISKFYNSDFVFYSVMTAFFALSVYLLAVRFESAFVALKIVIILAGLASCIFFTKKISSLKISKKRKASFLTFPAYIPVVLGAVFLFWRYFTVNSALFLTLNTMLLVLFAQYIVFAIVYTIRLIRD